MHKVDLWIGGKARAAASGARFDSLAPLDDSVFADVADGGPEDVNAAVDAAKQAFGTFRHSLAKDREALLMRTAALLEDRIEEFAGLLVDEIGSPISKARYEVSQGIAMLRAAAGGARQVTGKTMPSDKAGMISMSFRAPLGVVAVVTPFNVPIIKGTRLIGNAIAAGNCVVQLPSEFAPTIAVALAGLFDEAGLPPGVLNVVTGHGERIGDTLTAHRDVAAVTFTGSSRVGRHIAELCAGQMKPLVLELGGKSPLVVMADADLDKAVEGAVFGIFMYQGQICMGSSRVYVEDGIYDAFVAKFAAAAERIGRGDLRDTGTMIGPIISDRQRQRVRQHVEDALAKGAVAVAGGAWEGNRCRPTILTGVTPEMICHAEETFGPVASVYRVGSLDEAISCANDSVYGLSAAIYTSDITNAFRFVREVESGMVHVNAPTLHDEPNVPFGGVGESGFGREGVEEDIATLTEWKWATVQL